ncbi:hypothetical protein GQ651_00265 [Alphaproteobacteria bacterium GH1-50]|uniref:Uncharacterized protein n=1 Tax=Kangsaoukella pontilimi TaxID=2691042 RepID=A0A7C9IDU2_9RHOB|nr:hypothetical protein [Kangsaoukella pontilimi]
MTALRLDRGAAAKGSIETAIRDHGAARVLWAALVALLRARTPAQPRPPDAGRLPPYLRRDVGLPPVSEKSDWRTYR